MNFALPVGSLEKSFSLLIVFSDLERGQNPHNESPINQKEKSSIPFEIRVFIHTTINTMKQQGTPWQCKEWSPQFCLFEV